MVRKIWIAVIASLVLGAEPAAAAHQIGDLEYRATANRSPLDDSTDLGIGCGREGGRDILGGGVRTITSEPEEIFLNSTRPHAGAPSWINRLFYENAGAPPEKVTAYSICGRHSNVRYEMASVPLPSTMAETWFASVDCQGPRRHVVAGGVDPGSDRFVGGPVTYINSTLPRDSVNDANAIPDDGWQAFGFQPQTFTTAVKVFAVCLKGKMPEYATRTRTGIGGVGERQTRCPNGSHAVGGGGVISGLSSAAHLMDTHPVDRGDGDKAPDDAWQAVASVDSSGPQELTVHAICLD